MNTDQELSITTKVANALKPKLIKHKDRMDVRCQFCNKYYQLSANHNCPAYYCMNCFKKGKYS